MIPTMILFGLLLGRWWRLSLVAAAIVWPLLLVVDGVMGVGPELFGGSALGVLNAGAGVLVHQAVLRIIRSHRTSAS